MKGAWVIELRGGELDGERRLVPEGTRPYHIPDLSWQEFEGNPTTIVTIGKMVYRFDRPRADGQALVFALEKP